MASGPTVCSARRHPHHSITVGCGPILRGTVVLIARPAAWLGREWLAAVGWLF